MTKRFRVVMTRPVMPPAMELIRSKCEVRVWEQDAPIDAATLIDWVKDCDGLFCVGERVDQALLDAAPKLKVVSQPAVGYDNIDIAACSKRGIPVGNTPGVLTDATADLAMTHILTAARRFCEGWNFVRSGEWKYNIPTFMLGTDVKGKALGIVGFGQIGQAVAARARAFGMRIAYFDPMPKTVSDCEFMPLDKLLSESDFISLHVALTPETKHLISKEKFALMKSSAILINMARGPIVDSAALIEALKTRKIAFASLDVFDPEPIPADHPILTLDNVVITSHMGSSTVETRTAMALIAAENLINGLENKPLRFCVNP
ncbi:D-glycerate dehydrogenase [Anaerosporomusa subterranea]|uniref:D-glycerate dehydrogenase n=1 Tax=Anaerosporomusa subterranea TaxID=1794912 RepID=A0A154BPQ5_ANASB|nr:D-glycerate dehydrogenase [Anaerosporomusa subterranea]KYZ75964.1 D-glycerate dehydrogenase [Anaerosporomusa subterranea]